MRNRRLKTSIEFCFINLEPSCVKEIDYFPRRTKIMCSFEEIVMNGALILGKQFKLQCCPRQGVHVLRNRLGEQELVYSRLIVIVQIITGRAFTCPLSHDQLISNGAIIASGLQILVHIYFRSFQRIMVCIFNLLTRRERHRQILRTLFLIKNNTMLISFYESLLQYGIFLLIEFLQP